ncbi:hypothetical protein [Planococcus halocryophilus]|nr:hypothetical protein [Planococcus halocryophilus]MCH4825765.1 hypothetical protein [Planococcus halocryophilus]
MKTNNVEGKKYTLTEIEKKEMELKKADPFEYWLKYEGFGKLGGGK